MSRTKTLLLGSGGLVLILALAFYHGIEKIEQDLRFRGAAVMTEHKLQWVSLEVEGRNLRLLGEAPSNKAADRAIHLLEALDGVNRVIDQFALQPDQHTTTKPASDDSWSSSIKAR